MSAASNAKGLQLPRARSGNVGSDALLFALRSAHRQIDRAFAEVGAIAPADPTDIARFNATRLRIAQANLARRRLVDQIRRYLTSALSAEEGDHIRDLRRRDEGCFQKFSLFVRRWAPEDIFMDWDAYCVAAHSIQTEILMIVSAEKQLLYPLLERTS